MAGLPKARYTRDFKIHAVSVAEDERLGVAETVRRLSIFSKIIATCVKLARGLRVRKAKRSRRH